MRSVLVVSLAAISISACGIQRQLELRSDMDAAYRQCMAGDQAGCQRYLIAKDRWQAEGNVGILGIQRPAPASSFTCTTQQTLPGQSETSCN